MCTLIGDPRPHPAFLQHQLMLSLHTGWDRQLLEHLTIFLSGKPTETQGRLVHPFPEQVGPPCLFSNTFQDTPLNRPSLPLSPPFWKLALLPLEVPRFWWEEERLIQSEVRQGGAHRTGIPSGTISCPDGSFGPPSGGGWSLSHLPLFPLSSFSSGCLGGTQDLVSLGDAGQVAGSMHVLGWEPTPAEWTLGWPVEVVTAAAQGLVITSCWPGLLGISFVCTSLHSSDIISAFFPPVLLC